MAGKDVDASSIECHSIRVWGTNRDQIGNGGYIMANGAFFDEVKWDNLKAILETVKEYGVYK